MFKNKSDKVLRTNNHFEKKIIRKFDNTILEIEANHYYNYTTFLPD